ncbi:glycosyltransferase family 4 protein [Myxococcota bacterium]|nr:glycosyltransferase family 4 protein [Myxococcota bacterium]
MRIALVHKRFDLMGGTERHLVGLARGLASLGHDVHVFCASLDPTLSGTRGVTFHRLRVLRGGTLLKALSLFWAAGRVRREEFDRVVSLGRTLPCDVYRAGGGCHRAYWEQLVAGSAGLRRWSIRLSPLHAFYRWVERRQLGPAGASRVVAVSRLAAAELAAAHPEVAPRLRVVWNGVDLDRFHPRHRETFFAETRRECGIEPHEDMVLFVGNGWERKGLDTAMRALALLADPDVKLVVVGSEPRPQGYMQLARELGIRSHVVFAGPAKRVERFYAAADVLLLPTRYDPFANACLEALASGVPIVTSLRNGAAELMDDQGPTRVVRDPEDAAGFARAVAELRAVPDRQDLARRARAVAEGHGEAGAVRAMARILEEAEGRGA